MTPKTLTLVRHGQCVGNIDKSVLKAIPNEHLELTPEGEKQVEAAIPVIRNVIGSDQALFYTSPYLRCKRTAAIIRAAFDKGQTILIEDNNLREHRLGNLVSEDEIRDLAQQLRALGFFYSPPCGESVAEVFTRTEIFRASMKTRWNSAEHPRHVVIIGHNIALKTFLMAELLISATHFGELGGIGNAQVITLRPKTTNYGVQYFPDKLPIGITEAHINSTIS